MPPRKRLQSKKRGQSELPIDGPVAANVVSRPISDEMQDSYLDYAMSVIMTRALPDVRDGLKPVHRRILYAMWKIGLKPNVKFRKSATVVGEVLGKYHPHGDSAVYDSLVRMAQYFSMRHMLVHGQGNFGSMDGDSAAAMRYTECKLAGISEEVLTDIERDTVDFVPNYDGEHKEPTVLPSKIPNLLLNGTVGIAVGMATSIPPHNLVELCEAIDLLIENPEATVEDLMAHVKGPDFPTGGIIYDTKAIAQAYLTGRGGIVMRAKTDIVEDKSGQFRIIVSEIPYMVNKATLLEKIAALVQTKKIDGIRDLCDESSKEGVRVVIELKKDAYPKKVLNRLFHLTPLQDTFHVNLMALVDGLQPRVLNLKSTLEYFIEHRKQVIRRRTEFDLAKAKARAHVLEGLKIALDNLDQVIKTIRASYDRDEAKQNLIKKFKLSEIQADAILEMKLHSLANLERKKVDDEFKEKMKLIKELESILSSAKRVLQIVKDETTAIKDKHGEPRRTQVVPHGVKEFAQEDLIPNESTIVIITQDGYIKRLPPDTFRTQIRGGKGITGLKTKEEDIVTDLFATTTHADMYFFTTRGRMFKLKAYDVPQTTRTSRGQAMVNFLQLAPNEKVSAVLSSEVFSGYKYLLMATSKGTVKKTVISEFANIRSNGLIAIKLNDSDTLKWVRTTNGEEDVMMVTRSGQSIRFSEKNIRPMGRVAAGVRGIKFKGGDAVVGMDVVPAKVASGKLNVLMVSANGYGKRTDVSEYRIQGRGGSGIRTAHVTKKIGEVVSGMVVNNADDSDLMVVSTKGQIIRVPLNTVSKLGRDTQGVRVMTFKQAGDSVSSVTLV
ncbi:DNA gyrase subunit A [Candidatus Uhrbacteria bacterium CG_4_10_14_0_8_um_filter_58_22]|uniref:DNA gyrase subunit A n=1 Tax=Candidatus Uhrbacteria bacterium CG_4_10_14_0_8_um_filter_58_22 TaxID=1975029 RepID=A0A2M7Q8P3_9BACT|nr:MAG: DNA gyrase subunit A [Candidatus Uhrbacteria bacterium CG_4_10_14_0_8_um_filter_58_22]